MPDIIPAIKKLHIGKLLDVANVPLCLNGSGLLAHTLIVGQSGSGKSSVLGRLMEEIVANTKARVVIFDPNSDFVKFSEINFQQWNKEWAKPLFDFSDTPEAFKDLWRHPQFSVLTSRTANDLGLQSAVTVEAPTLYWGKKDPLEIATELGFDSKRDSAEMAIINALKLTDESFESFYASTHAMWVQYDRPPWEGPAGRVHFRARELRRLQIWAEQGDQGSVHRRMENLFQSEKCVTCLDLGSLKEQDTRLMVANAVLETLWVGARKAWLDAIKGESEADKRLPVFIVIDEAHNLAASGTAASDLAKTVKDILARIATEGRKYGLYLVLVTQRPSRLDETIRSQCDNLLLLKMNNRHDLQLIEDSFGFIPAGWAQRAMNFTLGDVLLTGGLVDYPVYSKAAPRRTTEGGRNLRETWLK